MGNGIVVAKNDSSLSVLAIEGKINKEDIVNIGVAKLEQKLIAAEKVGIAAWKAAMEASQNAQKALSKALNLVAEAELGSKIKNLNDAFKALGGIGNVAKISGTELHIEDKSKYVLAHVQISGSHCAINPIKVLAGKSVLAANKAVKDTAKEEDKASTDLNVIREKMGQMTRLERQLAARLAEAELSTTEKGANLVALIEESTDDFMKTL